MAPVAGLPAIAGAPGADDPVFAALAAFKRESARADETGEAHSIAEHAYLAARPERAFVVADGVAHRDHALIDGHFDNPGLSDEAIRCIIENCEVRWARKLSPAEQAERERARQAAHEELDRIFAADADADARAGFSRAEEVWNAAVDDLSAKACAVFEVESSTPAGALALLRFVADDLSTHSGHEEEIVVAIRRAVAVLEPAPPA